VVWFAFSARASGKRRGLCFAALIAGLAVTVLIQPIVNLLSAGRVSALPGVAGIALWQANNPLAAEWADWEGDAPALKAFIESHGFGERLKTADPVEKERIYRSLALSWIRENPWQFLALMPKKFNDAFGMSSRAPVGEAVGGRNRLARVAYLLSYGLMAPFALGGMIAALRRWRTCFPLYIVVLSYLPTVLVFNVLPRYTLLITPVLLIFASFAMLAAYNYLVGSRRLSRLAGIPGQPS
jgi:hypothetical protein